MKCHICGAPLRVRYVATEMMLGLRETFDYYHCERCQCLQISSDQIQGDFSRYYPVDYYSQSKSQEVYKNTIKGYIKRFRDKVTVQRWNPLIRLLSLLFPDKSVDFLLRVPLRRESSILDIGCGNGFFPIRLRSIGFTDLTGVDPLCMDLYTPGLKLARAGIDSLDRQFDVIMLNHSLEHIPDQLQAISKLKKILAPGGSIVIRIPVFPSFAWEKYGTHWVQLDAPRHFYIHSIKSMRMLSAKSSLQVVDVFFDSTELQFWGSEQYLAGIPLNSPLSYAVDPGRSRFTRADVSRFKRHADRLNRESRGDQAVFILRHAG